MPEEPQKRTFSFSAAAALLPEVRRLTEEAHRRVDALRARAEGGEDAAEMEAQANQVIGLSD